MFGLLITFAFWPWILFAALVICLVWASAIEEPIFAGVALAIYVGIAWFVFGTNPLMWIYDNPGSALVAFGLYAGIGLFWAMFKWRNFIVSMSAVIDHAKKKWVEGNPSESFTKEAFMDSDQFPVEIWLSRNKSRIVNWIWMWPFSAVSYIAYDMLRHFFTWIFDMASGLFRKITASYIQ